MPTWQPLWKRAGASLQPLGHAVAFLNPWVEADLVESFLVNGSPFTVDADLDFRSLASEWVTHSEPVSLWTCRRCRTVLPHSLQAPTERGECPVCGRRVGRAKDWEAIRRMWYLTLPDLKAEGLVPADLADAARRALAKGQRMRLWVRELRESLKHLEAMPGAAERLRVMRKRPPGTLDRERWGAPTKAEKLRFRPEERLN